MLGTNFQFREGSFRMDAPNGIRSYLETFYNVAGFIERSVNEGLGLTKHSPEQIRQAFGNDGHPGLYDLAIGLTNKFEEQNKNREWDGEFPEEIDNFLHAELPPQ